MSLRHIKVGLAVVSLGLACTAPPLLARKKEKSSAPAPATAQAAERKRALHALNRLGFGPRPGDVNSVMAMGVEQWIAKQLHPEKIDDKGLEARLAPYRAARMNAREVLENFPDPRKIKAVMDGKSSMPSDPAQRAIYEVQILRLEDRQKGQTDGQPKADRRTGSNDNGGGSSNNGSPHASSTGADSTAAADAMPRDKSASAETTGGRNEASGPMTDGNRMSDAAKSDASNSNSSIRGSDAADVDAKATPEAEAKLSPEEEVAARKREDQLYADLKTQQAINLSPDQRFKQLLAMSAQEKLAVADSLRTPQGQAFLDGMNDRQKETLLAMSAPQMIVAQELAEAKLIRAVYSDRQLEEVMTDFWFNHFNVYIGKGIDRLMVASYERDAIRPHVLGKFEDLLVATAKSPAMLFYLDNWLSVGPDSPRGMGIAMRPMPRYGPYRRRYPIPLPNPKARGKRNIGLNENYGRELLELHTLSVNGGYSQRDVTEVAKVFTGWTIDDPYKGGGFKFDARMHEPGTKFVLGHKIKSRGEDEGRQVLHLLATNPSTAHFISLKLAQRFVSDDPPKDLVDRMAKTFSKKKGDIREVLFTLFRSPEFWSDQAYRAKVKTPLEFVASAVRATAANVTDALQLTPQLNGMGMPLYGMQPPTGYSMKADSWIGSSALLGRMNFAVALTAGKIRGVNVDTARLAGEGTDAANSGEVLAWLENMLLAGDVSKQTHDSIVERASLEEPQNKSKLQAGRQSPPADTNAMAGFLVGSPEFQRR